VLVPWTCKTAKGVVVPSPTLPNLSILKTETPVDDETLKISLAPAFPCKLKVMVEEEAFTPKTVPLSIRVEVAKEEEVSHLAA